MNFTAAAVSHILPVLEDSMLCPHCETEHTVDEPCLCLPANYFMVVMRSAKVEAPWTQSSREWPIQGGGTKAAWIMPIGEA